MNGTLAERLAACRRICFDTAAIIYLLEGRPNHQASLRPVFASIDGERVDGFVSAITLMEVLVKPMRDRRTDLVEGYSAGLTRSRGFRVFPVDRNVARLGAELRAGHPSLKAPDALQLATASLHEADAFLTDDKKLRGVGLIDVVVIDDFLPGTAGREQP